MDSLSTANVEFCLDVFKELSSNHAGDNVFFSPLSLLYALSMILLGARGDSAAQMEKVLHFNHTVESSGPEFKDLAKCNRAGRIHSELGALFSQINRPDSNYTLSIANRLYGTKAMAFHEQYLHCSEKLYQARLQTVDFERSAEETRKTINAWVESKTDGKVTNLFGKGTIEPSCVMVLVNAIYFKGQWQSKFRERETFRTPFQLSKGKSVTVEMMYQTGKFKLALIEEPQMQVLELPYVNNTLGMIILLPVGTADLDQTNLRLQHRVECVRSAVIDPAESHVEAQSPKLSEEIRKVPYRAITMPASPDKEEMRWNKGSTCRSARGKDTCQGLRSAR
ncbi:PREDICTED: serpin B11 isoform X2 [Capra hircus]|uniref:serpin B11 isoform X2 n=1 Tax=Capra hircus TaxID=9925 RepID=UPI000847BE68|nr:PREDICTED: serpin B11 isoform X2 [Capra hircus]